MRLLITTQIVDRNDTVLGSFHRWIEEFAKECEQVTVICLKEGEHHFPPNVTVHSLGKEGGVSRIKYLRRLLTYSWRYRHDYDAVFVHMNPEYLVLLGWFWRLWGKNTALWYTHREVNLKLRIAAFFAHKIFSSSPYSFRLKTPKVLFLGHGIAVEDFSKYVSAMRDDQHPIIVTVGRITPIKNDDTFIEAAALLRDIIDARFIFIGGPLTEEDTIYEGKLRAMVSHQDLTERVIFEGAMPYEKTAEWYGRASLAVNLTPPGGLDKSVIEGMAAGCPTITSNIAYQPYLGAFAEDLMFPERDASVLAEKIKHFLVSPNRRAIRASLAETAKKEFAVESIVGKIVSSIHYVRD